jgi:hypothetical protein
MKRPKRPFPTVIYTIAGQLEKPSCQPYGVIPVSSNQPQKVKTAALKWVITRGQNPEHCGSQTSRLL